MFQVNSIRIQSPWFEHIVGGRKKIEGRVNVPPYSTFQKGTLLEIHHHETVSSSVPDDPERTKMVVREVVDVISFPTLEAFLGEGRMELALPDVKSLEEGKRAYEKLLIARKLEYEEYGMVAIYLKQIDEKQDCT